MYLDNSIKESYDISVEHNTGMIKIIFKDIDSEYAVIVNNGKSEIIAGIIKDSTSTLETDEKLLSLKIVNIYTDEVVFEYTDHEPDNSVEEVSIEENSSFEPIIEMSEMKKELPPPLITKKTNKPEYVFDSSIFNTLKIFDTFDCKLPKHNMYEFDEDILKENNSRIMFNGSLVPAWFPYLSYTDRLTLNSSLPQKIIGEMQIGGVDYVAYGVLCSIKDSKQPFLGTTGFSYLVPCTENYGYWLMYLDVLTGKICYPYDEEYMSADTKEDIFF